VRIREATDADVEAIARLILEADDARVASPAGVLHMRRTRPERGRMLDLVAEIDGTVVATGVCGLNISTTTEGAAWAFVTVDSRARRQGIGDALGTKLLEHLHGLGATKATSFFRWTEEGERWATVRGWSRLLGGPLIAVDPRTVAEPSIAIGYRCVPMTQVAPEAVYEAVRAAALDEPTPVRHDDIRLDDFLREWNEPDADLESSTAVPIRECPSTALATKDAGPDEAAGDEAGSTEPRNFGEKQVMLAGPAYRPCQRDERRQLGWFGGARPI
jgi:N-acetylglutamate synthase-like GNAT family acetyltransferase